MKNAMTKRIKSLEKKVANLEKTINERMESIQMTSNIILATLHNTHQTSTDIPPEYVPPPENNDEGYKVANPAPLQRSTPEPMDVPEEVEVVPVEDDFHNEDETRDPTIHYDPDEDDAEPPLDVVMPLAEGRYLHNEVLRGIVNQGMNVKLWISTKVSNGDFAASKNHIKQYGQSEFVMMMDNDLILPSGTFHRMIELFHKYPKMGVIGISKHHVPDPNLGELEVAHHVDAGVMMIRNKLLKAITYQNRNGIQCECLSFCEDVRRLKYETGYLTGVNAMHILDTKFKPKET